MFTRKVLLLRDFLIDGCLKTWRFFKLYKVVLHQIYLNNQSLQEPLFSTLKLLLSPSGAQQETELLHKIYCRSFCSSTRASVGAALNLFTKWALLTFSSYMCFTCARAVLLCFLLLLPEGDSDGTFLYDDAIIVSCSQALMDFMVFNPVCRIQSKSSSQFKSNKCQRDHNPYEFSNLIRIGGHPSLTHW